MEEPQITANQIGSSEEKRKERAKPRRWTPEEDALFFEGLKLFGRDWSSLSQHIQTRDVKSVKSHAQKSFIKMLKENIPLPEKVKESGAGYTISGKELDLNSTAAKMHGLQGQAGKRHYQLAKGRKILSKLIQNETLIAGKILVETKTGSEEAVLTDDKRIKFRDEEYSASSFEGLMAEMEVDLSSRVLFLDKSNPDTVYRNLIDLDYEKCMLLSKPRKKVKREVKPKAAKTPRNSIATKEWKRREKQAQNALKHYNSEGVANTEYSKGRSRRQRTRRKAAFEDGSTEPEFVHCVSFAEHNSTAKKSEFAFQPFSVDVGAAVSLITQLHACLSMQEVIGYLGGRWEGGVLNVTHAFPGRSVSESPVAGTECEMDPGSAVCIQKEIEELGVELVGWYHSHPSFVPNPSNWDVQNQANYQQMFDDKFVGLIVTPYLECEELMSIDTRWFYVLPPVANQDAFFLDVNEAEFEQPLTKDVSKFLLQKTASLFTFDDTFFQYEFVDTENRVIGSEEWMPDITFDQKIQSVFKKWLPKYVSATQNFQPEEFVKNLPELLEGEDLSLAKTPLDR